uniref:Uncharacterized protein n=1 Tax=Aegilops tauschii subsp. strangulata TaxID=200361 RepID=A0A453RAY4_AEGTS
GQQHRRPAQGRQGDAAGRHRVQGEAAGVRGRRAARPPGLPAARVGAGQAARRPRAPARARRAAPPGPALLPRRAAPPHRAPAPRLVRRAPRRRAREARVAHAHAPLHLRPHLPDLGRCRYRAALPDVYRLRGRAGPAQDAPAQGAGRQAYGREPGRCRGGREDHAALRRQRRCDAGAEPAVPADGGLRSPRFAATPEWGARFMMQTPERGVETAKTPDRWSALPRTPEYASAD